MKKTIIYTVLFAALSMSTACRKKGCTDENALNYDVEAQKDDGSCIEDPRSQYLGSYVVTDSSFGGGSFISTKVYTLVVDKGTTSDNAIILNNWRGTGDNYPATLTGATFTIPDNGNPANGGIFGNGSFSGSTITYTAKNYSDFETQGKGQK